MIFFLLFKRFLSPPPQYHQCTAPNGFRFVFTTPPSHPPRITCQINFTFSLLPTSHSPLLPSQTPSPRLDILQASYAVIRIVTFSFTPSSHIYSSRRLFLPFPRLAGRGVREEKIIQFQGKSPSGLLLFFFLNNNNNNKKDIENTSLELHFKNPGCKGNLLCFVIYMLSSFEVFWQVICKTVTEYGSFERGNSGERTFRNV